MNRSTVRSLVLLLSFAGCTPNVTASPEVPGRTSRSEPGAIDTNWIRHADRLDFTYVEADLTGAYEVHARLERADRKFEIVEDLRSECPSGLYPKCTTTQRLVHRRAELPESALLPLLEAVARSRPALVPNTVRIPEGEGSVRRSLVITSSTLGGGARVLAIDAEDGAPLELGTDRRWSVDAPSAKTIRAHLDGLVNALALPEWIREEAARWARSP